MENPTFVDDEDLPMLHKDEDDYDYKTPDTSRVDEASFIEPDTTEATSTLRLRQKVKRDKINALYRHLNVTADPGLVHLDEFRLTKGPKKGVTIFEFYNGNGKANGRFFCCKDIKRKIWWIKHNEKCINLR